MHVQLVRSFIPFSVYFNHVFEISLMLRFKLQVQPHAKTSSNTARVIIFTFELAWLRLRENNSSHSFRQVSNSHCDFIVLIWFDIYTQIWIMKRLSKSAIAFIKLLTFKKDLWWKYFDWFIVIPKMVHSIWIYCWLGESLQDRRFASFKGCWLHLL